MQGVGDDGLRPKVLTPEQFLLKKEQNEGTESKVETDSHFVVCGVY